MRNRLMPHPRKLYGCIALAALALVTGGRGLETAVANGDTRTISLHHIHTNEDITITFKRDGRYDEEALKKLNWFVRDWRKDEQIVMDPHLYDLVWEAAREVGGNKVIYVVCGYRSPETNAMLHARSNGVADHSQHMLGKAMDFYIPGASLEELRNVGLRLQRGGVGYYPTSGSPFVHLDVGNVRHWGPSIGDAEMAKIMSGHAVHVASATTDKILASATTDKILASATTDKILASATTDKLLASATADKYVAAATVDKQGPATQTALYKKPAANDQDAAARIAPARTAAVNGFALASVDSKPVEANHPASVAAAPAKTTTSAATSGTGVRAPDRTKAALSAKAPAKTAEAESSGVIWPVRVAESDRVPLDMALGYAPARSAETGTAMRPESTGSAPARIAPVAAFKPMPANANPDNTTTVAKKTTVRIAALDEAGKDSDRIASEPAGNATVVAAAREADEPFVAPATRVTSGTVTTRVITNPMRYDDPWLRAMILTPSISDSMTATLYGRPDLGELRNLMRKPRASLMLSFGEDPFSGPAPDQFRGDAVVFMNNHAFDRRTASLH
jgi:uncharacterized protein YcbK (DUF882 family)